MPKSAIGSSIARRVLDRLRQEFRSAGHGAMRRVSADLGLQPDHLSKMIRRGHMDIGVFFGALERLQIRPETFVFGVLDPSSEDDCPVEPVLEEQRIALEILSGEGPEDETPSLVRESVEEWLVRLDESRYEDAYAVLSALRTPPSPIPKKMVPKFLGVSGSAYRNAGARLREAELCLRTGTWVAEVTRNRPALAELLQRTAYVLADHARFDESLFLAERATGIYLASGDRVGAGKALVDQGVFLGYLERFEEAVSASETALEFLPEDQFRNRCAALHSLAKHHKSLGDSRQALGYLEQADRLADRIGGWLRAKIYWFKGELLFDAKMIADAERHFAIAYDAYQGRSPLAMALVAADLLLAQRYQGKMDAVHATLRSTIPLIDQLHENRLATSALMELLRSNLGDVTPALILSVKSKLQQASKNGGAPPAPSSN